MDCYSTFYVIPAQAEHYYMVTGIVIASRCKRCGMDQIFDVIPAKAGIQKIFKRII
ncbi:hypothetical protein [Rickettsia endosymbiont of Orchestes rusci]|uniref:hypothetical protein n=1 Tax=Rickettsia endosymbiont of Orchestes rusci TaxID=3066250 RepID=UPI00313EED07